jgi:hypothetical protein
MLAAKAAASMATLRLIQMAKIIPATPHPVLKEASAAHPNLVRAAADALYGAISFEGDGIERLSPKRYSMRLDIFAITVGRWVRKIKAFKVATVLR